MSAVGIETYVLLFPNEEWSDDSTGANLDATVAQLSPNISFSQVIEDNIQSLSVKSVDRSGVASGLLYVPDLGRDDACYNISKEYIPANVTRQANLPPTDFTLIAIAPWINIECTRSFLDAARLDPNKAFLFYLPDNSTDKPPSSSSSVWDLQDGGSWKRNNMYPVYALPGEIGQQLVRQLALYSGNMTNVPYGHDISELPGVDPRDYVRLYTEIDTSNMTTLPTFWVMIVVVLAVLVVILGLTSGCMHWTQRRRRSSLKRRVERGEVNLEALGITRLTIPQALLDKLPVFVYRDESENIEAVSLDDGNETALVVVEENKPKATATSTVKRLSEPSSIDSAIVLPPEDAIVDISTDPDVELPHKFLPYAQPSCPICLDGYVSRVTEIRELPCGHIFHPECIDAYLGTNSSLCPLCKQCALPPGYCPVKITNGMVRRERNLRRLRHHVPTEDPEAAIRTGQTWNRMKAMSSRSKHARAAISLRELSTLEPPLTSPTTYVVLERPRPSLNYATSEGPRSTRQEYVAARVRELASRQTPIQDPDRRERPKWRSNLSKAFPGFA
ncbi:hypothetical protein BJ875DRAFT_457803 [Amylocarpus encephaloides]|uniref:RING-type domain-containing protein n=1 Tax=Amylocarpus encephaloides TaxID=45428 RepID=A0A9P7YLA6_9HELO|nr:hypothetical protein BJ875DRAFT_457803 [Amylocarpus encephaloides]